MRKWGCICYNCGGMKTHTILLAAFATTAVYAFEIPVDVPARGYVSLQIFDSKGEVVGHAISQEPLEKGSRTVEWNRRGIDDGKACGEGG